MNNPVSQAPSNNVELTPIRPSSESAVPWELAVS